MEFVITIRNKIAEYAGDAIYVCGNADCKIVFDFDIAWDGMGVKTARFVKDDGTYQEQVFTGNECPVPVISDTYGIRVGVYAGNLHTTTPAYIPAKKSILCASGMPSAPSDDVYAQIMEMIDDGLLKGEKGDKGEPGEPGKDGEPGEKGDPGEPGKDAEPYTLPTASAEVKGGVKVGSGLRMNGDALEAESEEYAPLETIMIAEEGIMEIVRGDIALFGVRVTMNAPASTKGNDNAFVSVFTLYGQGVVVGATYISGTNRMSVRYDIWKNGNIWDGKSTGYVYGWGGGNILGMNSASELAPAKKDEHISYLRMYTTNNGFPIGTVIKIYGVRK